MRQVSAIRPDLNARMKSTVRVSSAGRAWNGLSASIYDTFGGYAETRSRPFHSIVMHIGAPVSAWCRCDGRALHRRRATPGDIDLLPEDVSASWQEDGPTTQLDIHLAPALVRSAADSMALDPDKVAVLPQLQMRDVQVEHIGRALQVELESAEPHDRIFAEGLGHALAVTLLRRYARATPFEPRRGLSRRRLRAVLDHIEDNLGVDLKLVDLATVAGVSPSHFMVLFKQSTGVAAHQFIMRRRVERAVEMVARGRSRLCDVAHENGFSDQSHMARWMRRVVGSSPAAILRRYR